MSRTSTTTRLRSLPLSGIVPKEETNALKFVSENPSFDGRNVVIGILDTGVDPGAIGLQSTTDGSTEPKVINLIDCSGSGDVDISKETTAVLKDNEDGSSYWEVTTLTGRKVKLSSKLELHPFPPKKKVEELLTSSSQGKEESNGKDGEKKEGDEKPKNIRLGIKRAYELFPAKLKARVKEHRKKAFEEKQRHHAAKVHEQLDMWHSKFSVKSANSEQLKAKEELEARLEIFEPKTDGGNDDGKEPWEDPGPLFDCIVYFDGENYRTIIIDADQTDDFTDIELGMTDYHKEFQYKSFSSVDMYNYGVNFYDEGSILSIVCDAGAHGSHVAGIASAHHPNSSEILVDQEDTKEDTIGNINGVAPGAKIVSLKIGDTRLGSMETGTALTRALIEAIRLKVDVINLSYGEAAALADSGRFVELAEEAVQKYGIIFVSSAGNNGPALTTTGAPGGTCSSILSIGAYVSPNMMEAGYSLITQTKNDGTDAVVKEGGDPKDVLTGTTYTWSSVGPAADGDQGVDVCAPGGAITCVPNWTLQRKQLMNGTSMSSPHAAGCVALLISAMKAMGIPVSFNRIKRALQNTAKDMDGLINLQQGAGMIQVDKAWEYIKTHNDKNYEDVEFKVSTNKGGKQRGIYLRQPDEIEKKEVFSIKIDPNFKDDNVDFDRQKDRVEFEMNVVLESTSSWVESPDLFVLMNNGRVFKITVDPTKLPPGVHTAHVHGYDAGNRDRGPIFSVPITVTKPLDQRKNVNLGNLVFKPSEVKRNFLDVPTGATWMDVSVRDCRNGSDKDASSRLIVLHSLQLLPHTPYRDNEKQRYLYLTPGKMTITSIPVHAGVTCELAIARYWSASGLTDIEVDINFRGLTPTKTELSMISGGGGKSVIVESKLADETLDPSGKFTHWLSPLRPKTVGKISPLGERDVWPTFSKKIYQTVLTYEFEQEEAGGITLRVPSLQGYIYESAYESQFCMIYDSNKRLLGISDSYPKEVKTPKGKITVVLQVRHDDPKMLLKLQDQMLWIQRKLTKNAILSCYSSHERMVTGSGTFRKTTLKKGTSATVFFSEPKQDQLPKGYKPGDFLFGTVNYSNGGDSLPGEGSKPGGFPIRYFIGPSPVKENGKAKDAEAPDERSEFEKLDEALLKLKVDELKKLSTQDKDDKKFPELFDHILESHPNHIPLHNVYMKHQDQEKWRAERLEKIIEACDNVIKQIDQNELILHYGVTAYYDKEDGVACKSRKDMDEKKNALIEALGRKARAIADLERATKNISIDTKTNFDKSLMELQKWVKVESNMKYAVLLLEKDIRKKRYGAVYKLLQKLLEKDGEETKDGICHLDRAELLKRRSELFEILECDHIVNYDNAWKLVSKPKDFALF